jgi:hypothetical protein
MMPPPENLFGEGKKMIDKLNNNKGDALENQMMGSHQKIS